MPAPTPRDLEELQAAASAFARAHPALAPRLGQPSLDPDVERLLEGFAYLTQQVHSYLDVSASRIAAGVAEMLAPELLRPLPSATILELSASAPVAGRMQVAAGAEFESTPVDGVRCRFRSFADVTVVPWRTKDARFVSTSGGGAALRVELESTAPPGLPTASPFPLRLHLAGDRRASLLLRTVLLYGVRDVEVTTALGGSETRHVLPASAVQGWGLASDEALFPPEPGEHLGFRLAREYFALPAKAAFVTVTDDDAEPSVPAGTLVTLHFRLTGGGAPVASLTRDSVRTNCLPVANVFSTSADPVRPSLQLPLVPLRPSGLGGEHADVYAVRSAAGYVQGTRHAVEFPPFAYAASAPDAPAFYALHRTASSTAAQVRVQLGLPRDAGTGHPVEAASFELWATNRSLPMHLGIGDVRHASSTTPPNVAFRNIVSLSPHRPLVLGRALERRILAFLAAAYADRTERDVLCATLGALDLDVVGDGPSHHAALRRLGAIRELTVAHDAIEASPQHGPRLGRHVRLVIAETAFDGEGDAVLFGEVIARLLAHDAPAVGFLRTTLRLAGTGRLFPLPARSGDEEVG